MNFKPRFLGTIDNPSQFTVLEASFGCLTEVPLGDQVELWHMGEDGLMPQLATLRCFDIEGQTVACFEAFQDWFVDEYLDQAYLQYPEEIEP